MLSLNIQSLKNDAEQLSTKYTQEHNSRNKLSKQLVSTPSQKIIHSANTRSNSITTLEAKIFTIMDQIGQKVMNKFKDDANIDTDISNNVIANAVVQKSIETLQVTHNFKFNDAISSLRDLNPASFFHIIGQLMKDLITDTNLSKRPVLASSLKDYYDNQIPSEYKSFVYGLFNSQRVERSQVKQAHHQHIMCRGMTVFSIVHYHFNKRKDTHSEFQRNIGNMINYCSKEFIHEINAAMGVGMPSRTLRKDVALNKKLNSMLIQKISHIAALKHGGIVGVDNIDINNSHLISALLNINDPPDKNGYWVETCRSNVTIHQLINTNIPEDNASNKTTKDRVTRSYEIRDDEHMNNIIRELCDSPEAREKMRKDIMKQNEASRKGIHNPGNLSFNDKLLQAIHPYLDDSVELRQHDSDLLQEVLKMMGDNPELTFTDQATSRIILGIFDAKSNDRVGVDHGIDQLTKELSPHLRYWISADGQIFLAHHKWRDTVVQKKLEKIKQIEDGIKRSMESGNDADVEGIA